MEIGNLGMYKYSMKSYVKKINSRKSIHNKKNVRNMVTKNIDIIQGSATIELMLLLPFILSILILVIYTSLFLYNREAVQVAAYVSALKGAQMEDLGQDAVKKNVEIILRDQIDKKLPFITHCKYSIDVTYTKVKVIIKIEQKIPFSKLLKEIGIRNHFNYEVKKSVKRLKPIEFYWDVNRFENIN